MIELNAFGFPKSGQWIISALEAVLTADGKWSKEPDEWLIFRTREEAMNRWQTLRLGPTPDWRVDSVRIATVREMFGMPEDDACDDPS